MIARLNTVYASAPLWLRRSLVTVVGSALVLIGVVLLVLPGPGLVLIAAGFAVLGTEFPAARRLLDRVVARLPIAAVRSRLARLRPRPRVSRPDA